MSGASLSDRLHQRLTRVEERIESACRRAGRSRHDVQLIVVTKSVSTAVAQALHELGIVNMGESRPQELWRKSAALPGTIHWHQIGHLQTNKIERTLPLVRLIHSVDRVALLQALEKEASKRQLLVHGLLEVNASDESNKHGFAPDELESVLPVLPSLQWLRIRGLMTMAAYIAEPEKCRPTFALLRGLRDQLIEKVRAPHTFDELSMGMSNDFEVAIEEGATMVRLGTVLFEGISENEA